MDLDTLNPSEIIELNHFSIKVYLWGAGIVIKGSVGQNQGHFGAAIVQMLMQHTSAAVFQYKTR